MRDPGTAVVEEIAVGGMRVWAVAEGAFPSARLLVIATAGAGLLGSRGGNAAADASYLATALHYRLANKQAVCNRVCMNNLPTYIHVCTMYIKRASGQ